MISYDRVRFDYEPYPIGLIPEVFEPDFYRELTTTYPPLDLFRYMPELGNKYSLSEVNHSDEYHTFLKRNAAWARFHQYIKSREFVEQTLAMLRSRQIDLGLRKYRVTFRDPRARSSRLNAMRGIAELNARFEFSMMNGKGGHIRPHTDHPLKLITFVFSCMTEGEWDARWGGGTAVVWPKVREQLYNHMNRTLDFAEVEVLKEHPFRPNQALVFIKTWNSWHAVAPMTSPTTDALRKTITVNIETRRV